jgi:sodium/bile acid cotransporter 7
MSMAEHIWSTVSPWRVVAVAGVWAALLASGLPMAPVFFSTGAVGLIMLPLKLFHQTQLFVCAIIASRMSRTVAAD